MSINLESVKVREGSISLPTYAIKEENRNPVFRSQYGVAHIYPYTLLDDIETKKKAKDYHTLILENQYLVVTILTDLGGRVYSVFDKLTNREVFYKNSVVRFAPLAIRGAFFSGGVEFSFPVAHAPTTCDKVNWDMKENLDGSATISIGGLEHISRLRWMISLTLYPDRCALAQDVYLHNSGTIPGRYHYWTNASLDANDGTEFVYPLHRARSYEFAGSSSWPYSRLDLIVNNPGLPGMEGVPMWPANRLQVPVNFRWQKNMLAQVSIFGRNVRWDYFGAWQHRTNTGYAHIAKSKDVSGMKLWSWGNAPVGVVNQTSLTDDGSVYAETQCGAMETQLDFAFLRPSETRTWREWWLPLRGLGGLTCASDSIGAKITMIPSENDEKVTLTLALCPVYKMKNVLVRMTIPDKVLMEERIDAFPEAPWSGTATVSGQALADHPISLVVTDEFGQILLDYQVDRNTDPVSVEENIEADNDPANQDFAIAVKHENFDNREQAIDAYKQVLVRNPDHVEANIRLGLLKLRAGLFSEALALFERAGKLGSLDGLYYTGQTHLILKDIDQAEYNFVEASDRDPDAFESLIGLGKVAIKRSDFIEAAQYFEQAKLRSEETIVPEVFLSITNRLSGNLVAGKEYAEEVLKRDPLNLIALYELSLQDHQEVNKHIPILDRMLQDDPAYYIDLACFYLESGVLFDAQKILEAAWKHKPLALIGYLNGYINHLLQNETESKLWTERGQKESPEFGFPSRLEEMQALEFAIKENPTDFHAKYYLGNFYYARERYDEAVQKWTDSLKGLDGFDVVHRNLGLAAWQRFGDLGKAVVHLEKALSINPANQDLYLLLDEIYTKRGEIELRNKLLKKISSLEGAREDVQKHRISMMVDLGQFEDALEIMASKQFIPLEMDQSFHGVYVKALMAQAERHMDAKRYTDAIVDYQKMLEYPENLGVGAPTTRAQAHIYFGLGVAFEKSGNYKQALKAWKEAAGEHHMYGDPLYKYVQMALDKLSRYSEIGVEEV
jgi:tetratricopeptide (TPR) repeat protein